MNIERKKKGKNFIYIKRGNIIKDPKLLDRIKKLVIPPAWRNVFIADKSNDKIQCIGLDDKDRKQYRYHPDYIIEQTNYKYYRCLIDFGKNISIIRDDVQKILRKRCWNLEKLTAFIIYIIDKCHLRIGNEKYKDENESYGITTLEKRHIKIRTNSVSFDFIGKKGVENSCKLTDKTLVNLFKSLYKEFEHEENESFFKYYGHNGNIYTITSVHINDFLKQYGNYSAKIFRTWSANELIIKYLYNLANELYNNQDIEINSLDSLSDRNCIIIVNKCIDMVSNKLNNTRAICKKSYICNDIFDDFKSTPDDFIKKIKSLSKKKMNNCNGITSILIHLLSQYKNNLKSSS